MDTEEAIEKLGEEWGFVVVTHRPQYDDDFQWVVANHTDEGLGPEVDVEAHGETLSEAVQDALEGNCTRFP
ncbi:MAG: hypothetical protein ABEH81_00960 [Halopenitus sp.]